MKDSGGDGFWLSLHRLLDPGRHPRRPRHARSVHHAALHAGLARVADRSAHRRLARRQGLLPRPGSSTTRSTTPISASSPTSTSSPPASVRCRTPPTTPRQPRCCSARSTPIASMISFTAILWNLSGTLTLPIFGFEMPRAMFWIGLVYVLFATVIAFWIGRPIIWLSFNNEKFNAAFRYALVRLRDAVGGGRLLPRRDGRAHGTAAALRARRRQLQAVRQQDDGLLRLEPVDEPDHRARCRTCCSCRGSSRARSSSATSPSPRRRSAASRTGCRSSVTPTTSSPATGRRSSACTAWSSPTKKARALPEITTTPCVDGTVAARRRRGPHPRRQAADQAARHAAGSRRHVGDHRASPAAGKTTLLRSLAELWPFTSGHADAAVWAERDDVPVAAALCAAGRSARRGDATPREEGTIDDER